MLRTRIFSCAAAVAMAFTLATPALRAAAADPFEINVILSLSGPGSFLGKNEQTAIALVEERVNKAGGIAGRPIKFVIADDQSSPQLDVQLANALISKNVSAIVGPSLTAGCNAVQALLKADGPLLYCLSAGFHPPKGSYGFTFGPSTGDLIVANMRYFQGRGWKKIALITSTDASGQDGETGIDNALSRPEFKDMTLIAREHYAVADQTVNAQLSRIKAAGAQAMFAWGTGSPIGTVFHGYADIGLDLPIAVSASNLVYTEMKQFAGIIPVGFMSAGVPALTPESLPPGELSIAVRQFVDAFKAKGLHGDLAQSIGWDPPLILLSAYTKLGVSATAAQLRDNLAGLHGFAAADGVYDFRDGSQRGLGERSAIMVKWDAAKDTWVAISKFGGAPLK